MTIAARLTSGVAVALAGVPIADAEPNLGDRMAGLAMDLAGEQVAVPPRPLGAISLGAMVGDRRDVGLVGALRAGIAWGEFDTGLFGDLDLHAATVALRLGSGHADTLAVAADYEYHSFSLGSWSLGAGVDARLSDQRAIGPRMSASFGISWLALEIASWLYLAPELEAGGSLAVRLDVFAWRAPD